MTICGNCGRQNAVGARFCQWCGQELPSGFAPAGEPGTAAYPGEEDGPTQPFHPGYPSGSYPSGLYPSGLYPSGLYPPGAYGPTPGGGGYAPPPPPPPGGPLADAPRWFWPVVIALGGLMLLSVCAIAGLLLTGPLRGGGAALPTGQPTETLTWELPTAPPTVAQPSPFPTLMPRPTQTALPPLPPLPPTSTPIPTLPAATETAPGASTPIPAGPTPQGTPGWMRYLTPECAAAITRLQAASDQFAGNPLAAFDEDWRAELAEAGRQTRLACGTLEEASPVPGQMAEAQRNLTLAGAEFDQAGKLLDEGVSPFNPGKLWQGIQGMGRAAKYLSRALAALAGIGE